MNAPVILLEELTVEDDGVLADDYRPGLSALLSIWPT
jgi:hypothetical protein